MFISKALALRAFSVFVFLALVFFLGKSPLKRKMSKCADFEIALWGPSLGHNRRSYKVRSVQLQNSGFKSIFRFCLSGNCNFFFSLTNLVSMKTKFVKQNYKYQKDKNGKQSQKWTTFGKPSFGLRMSSSIIYICACASTDQLITVVH